MDESTLSKKEFKAAKAAEPVLEGAKDDADAELDAPFLSVRPMYGVESTSSHCFYFSQNKEIDKAIKKRKRDLLMDNLLEEDDVDTQGVSSVGYTSTPRLFIDISLAFQVKMQIPFHLQKHLVQEWEVMISHYKV